jgi:predicted nucleic acid-binding protein
MKYVLDFYVALADRENCKVITADEKLVARFPTSTVSLALY